MAGRDLSSELFDTPAEPQGKDLSSELFGEPNPFKETAPAATPEKKQPVLSKSTPVDGSYGMMGEYIEPEPTTKPPISSVMDVGLGRPSVPKGEPSTEQVPVRPEVRQAIRGNYLKFLDDPGWKGDIARQRKAELDRFAKARKAAPESRALEKVSPEVEDRTQRLIEAGEKPEFARVAAEEAAAAGVEPGKEIDFMQAKGTLGATDFNFKMADAYRNAPALVRAGVEGWEGLYQGGLGLMQSFADAVGDEERSRNIAEAYKKSRADIASIGENPNYIARQFEGAVSSIAQQLPGLFGGVLTGSEALVLGSMFLQSFGQEYSEGRSRGLDGSEAATRAGLFGAFEVIGERFGLKFELDNLRRATSGMKTDDLKAFLANTLKKELPGEYLTTTGQFLTDKSAIGLNKDATFEDYLKQMADTTVQTVMQSGLMTGGTKLLEKGVQAAQKPEAEEPIPTAEKLMRDKGFLVKPSRTASGKATTETVMETAAGEKAGETSKRVEPTLAAPTAEEKAAIRARQIEETATKIVETSGIDPDVAMQIAEGRVRAQEELAAKQEQKRQDGMQAEVEQRETLVKPAENRIQEITNDLIDAGMNPIEAAARAVLMAQQEVENDALAQQEGVTYAGKPITKAGGVSTGVSGERPAGVPTGGVNAPLAAGMVPTGTTTGEFTKGKAVQPSALIQAQQQLTQAQQEEASGAQTLETIEAEAQGAAAAEAGVPTTTGKRGRPRLAPEAKLTSDELRKQQRAAYKVVEKQVNEAERALAQSAEPIEEGEATSEDHLRDMQAEKVKQRQFAINTLYDVSKTNRGKPGARAKALLAQATPRELQTAEAGHKLRKQRGEAVSKAVEAAASATVADEKLGKVTNGAQAISQIIKTGTQFQKILAKRLRSFVSNVKIVVVEVGDPLPEGITKTPEHQRSWDRARALFIENYATGAKTIYVRGASFGEYQGVNNITMLHELWHAATNKKVELGRQAISKGLHKGTQLVRATEDLIQIMNNAGDRFNELAAQNKLPANISRLAQFGEIFDDPREFIAYGMTDEGFQEFLKSAGALGGTTSYWSMFVDALRRLVGMDEADNNALGDLLVAVDSILTARPVGQIDLTEGLSPMALFGFGKEKDTTTEFAGQTVTTKPSANAKRLAALLGAKLYGDPTDIAKVSIKEIFQNSFDAIKGALEKGQLKDGKIAIKLDEKARTITITDNGLGMPASVMGNEFLTIAGTVKETDRASGGLGIAKMLFLFGNEKMEVVSLRNGQLARMVTTGEEVMAALDDPSLAPKITTSTDPKVIKQYTETTFPDGHGTTIVVQIPKSFKDASTGEEKNIPFDIWQLESSKVLTDSPLFDNIKVTLDAYGSANTLPIGANFPIDDYTAFANVNFDWGTARVYVQKETQDYLPRDNTHILSNGLWQFDTNIKDRPGWDGNKIKRNFYIDVNPKVKPEDAGYPFDLNRQGFAPSIRGDFDKIFKYITVIYQQQSLAEEGKSFGQIQYVNDDGTLTKPEELVPEVPATPTAFTMIKPDDKVEVRDGVMYVNGRAVPELTDADLKNTVVRIEELTIPQDKIDTNRVMVHDNTLSKTSTPTSGLTLDDLRAQLPEGWTVEEDPTSTIKRFVATGPQVEGALRVVVHGRNIEYLANRLGDRGIQIQRPFETKQATLSEVAREMFGKKYDEYLVGIGNIFMELRNALATEYNGKYTGILNEAIGVSLDKEYYGVSIRVPFSGLYINPATTSLTGNSRQIAVSMVGTMIHEMAHHKERGHGADFASEMQRIMNLLETHPTFDLADAKKRLTDHIQKNINIFDFLNGEFKNGNLEPRGNRFQDASAIEAGDASTAQTMAGLGVTGKESRPGVPGGFEPSYQGTGKVGVGAGVSGEAEETGEDAVRTQKEINKEVAIAIEKVRISRSAEEVARQSKLLQALRDPRKIVPTMRRIWRSANYAQRLALVKLPTTEFLARWGGSYIPELMNTNVLLEKMSGLTQQLLNSSAIMAKTTHKAFKEDKTLKNKLENIAYASTIAQVDPSDANATERSPILDQMYVQLGAKGQQIYKLLLEHYQNMSDYFAQLLDEQIANSRTSTETQNNLMAKIREIYETGQKIKPYIPLVRRGDFFLAVGSGKHRQFFTFETMNERDAAAEEMAKERRTSLDELKADQTFVLGNDIGTLRRESFNSSAILKTLFDIIDSEDFSSPDVREELKDSIYQLYLTTMPEQSFRRQFISRKNITGFSVDLLRNFSTTSVKMATQLAKIKYAPLLRNSLSAAQDSIVGREDLQPFITRMQEIVNNKLSPEKRTGWDKLGDTINSATFLWYLSGASSALLQPLGVFQTGAPILMARYGQINATRELLKMMKVWNQYGVWRKNPDGSMSFVPPSIANAKGLTNDEKRAIREMVGRDVFQSTYASALFGYKSVPTEEISGAWNLTKRGAAMATGGLMHTTERLSREMIALPSYRLNRQAGKSHDESVNQAVIDTNEALGNYGQYNRPLYMQKGLGRVVLQFAMYPLHVTLFLMRNFKRMLPLLNKEGKWEATQIFFGVLGTTWVLAGASGLPMFSTVMGLLGWMWRDEDKPQEYKDMDYETWWRTIWLPEVLGEMNIAGVPLADLADRGLANAITGLDIASRTSLNDLWLRDTKETKTARESAVALAMEKAGPSAAMILSLADAYEAFGNGDYQKGIEKMSPALIRNFILTYKYAQVSLGDMTIGQGKGAKVSGAQVLLKDDYTTGLILGQLIGFRADALADTQQLAFKLTAATQRVENERSKILNNLDREYQIGAEEGKWGGYLKQLETMKKFNLKYPSQAITPEQLVESINKRLEQRAIREAWAGMPITKKNIPLIGVPAVKAVEKKEKRQKEKEGDDLSKELFKE